MVDIFVLMFVLLSGSQLFSCCRTQFLLGIIMLIATWKMSLQVFCSFLNWFFFFLTCVNSCIFWMLITWDTCFGSICCHLQLNFSFLTVSFAVQNGCAHFIFRIKGKLFAEYFQHPNLSIWHFSSSTLESVKKKSIFQDVSETKIDQTWHLESILLCLPSSCQSG